MSIAPTSPSLVTMAGNLASNAWAKLTGLFAHNYDLGFAPEQTLTTTPGIDPRFIPRAPMSNANLDLGLLTKLSNEGYKRGKEVTAQTHPELYRVWVEMCHRAGIGRVPQLIIGESKIINAASLNDENAVVVTTGLLKRLDLRELSAVLGHELGHESSDHNSPRVWAYGVFGLAGLLLGNRFANNGGISALIKEVENPGPVRRFGKWLFNKRPQQIDVLATELYMTSGAALGGVVARQISVRPTELDADSKGATISGDPQALISALNKLEDTRSQKHGITASIGRFAHWLISGYPANETRVSRLRHIAATLPPEVKPAIAVLEAPATEPALAPATTQPAAPGAKISHITSTERVGTPIQAPSAAV